MHRTLEHCDVSLEAGIARLCIPDAGALDILGTPVLRDVVETLRAIADVESLRVAVLRGTGDKAFSGGADVKEMAALTPDGAEVFIRDLHALCEAIRRFPVPVIARLPGWC